MSVAAMPPSIQEGKAAVFPFFLTSKVTFEVRNNMLMCKVEQARIRTEICESSGLIARAAFAHHYRYPICPPTSQFFHSI